MLAEVTMAFTMLGLDVACYVCVRLMLRMMREERALKDENARLRAENDAYAKVIVREILRGRMPPR